ncbi:MAG: helix-turn-helix transcriptional regulator [Clostridiales bacterium]|nr:helix-turn-helix transcriptional regulator [Clostridiales bacterium]
MKNSGTTIKEIRKNLGLSQEEFADRVGVARQTICKWEQDIVQPTPKNIAKIIEEFSLSPKIFYGEKDKDGVTEKKKSVFYDENKALKVVLLTIVFVTEILLLLLSAWGWVFADFLSKHGSTWYFEDMWQNDALYYGSIIFVLCIGIIFTVVGVIRRKK